MAAIVLIPAGRASATPASPAISSPPNGALLTSSFVTVEGTADPGARVTVTVSTGGSLATTADAAGRWSIGRTFSDTTHTLTAVARMPDGSQSATSAPVTFTVDTLVPSAPVITSPAPKSETNKTLIQISGSAEPNSTVNVYEGSTLATITTFGDGTFRTNVAFAVGAHSITARATDAAGHTSAASAAVGFTVDQTPPGAPTITVPVQDAIVAPGNVVVEGTAEPFATVDILRGTTVIAITTAGYDGTWSIRLQINNGYAHVAARARDRAGNTGPISGVRDFVVDGTPPVVSFTTTDGAVFLPGPQAQFTGTASDDWALKGVTLDFYDVLGRPVATMNAACQCYGLPQSPWSLVPHLLPGRYVVRAYALDLVGNKSDTATITVLILSL
jgi:hypothetical protein